VIASNWSRNRRNFISKLKFELKQLELKIEETKREHNQFASFLNQPVSSVKERPKTSSCRRSTQAHEDPEAQLGEVPTFYL
jgi:hypothetical protein